jgi:hypothetical protein
MANEIEDRYIRLLLDDIYIYASAERARDDDLAKFMWAEIYDKLHRVEKALYKAECYPGMDWIDDEGKER